MKGVEGGSRGKGQGMDAGCSIFDGLERAQNED